MLGVQAPGAVGADKLGIDHLLHDIHGQFFYLLHFVGGAEAVEEVQEGNPGFEGGCMGYHGEVHGFLDAGGTEHGPAGLAGGHDVLVVAEDGQGAGGHGPGGDVEDRRGALAGDLVHVGDHEEESLAGGEGGGQGAGGQGAMDGTGGAGLGLHLHYLRDGAVDVLAALGGKLVGKLAHGRGGCDRVDRDHLGARVGYMGGGGVAVDHDHVLGIGHFGVLWSVLSGAARLYRDAERDESGAHAWNVHIVPFFALERKG
jgi:hypothetical protein